MPFRAHIALKEITETKLNESLHCIKSEHSGESNRDIRKVRALYPITRGLLEREQLAEIKIKVTVSCLAPVSSSLYSYIEACMINSTSVAHRIVSLVIRVTASLA